MSEHAHHVFISIFSVAGIELLTGTNIELYTKLFCQCIICAATVYSLLKTKKEK